jgi:hypothetical protein
MEIEEHALFPTRLMAIRWPGVEGLNEEVYTLFTEGGAFAEGFDMHPDALNLLSLAGRVPAIARLGEMFREGLRRWLRAERVSGELTAEVVLFSNLAARGEYTMVHNHNADVVGVYYVRTPAHEGAVVRVPEAEGPYDYFDAVDGALVLHDPRFNANLAAVRANDYARVYPRPGLMVLFPGYLWHSVTPHLGEGKRLSISANFRLKWPGAGNAETWTVEAT